MNASARAAFAAAAARRAGEVVALTQRLTAIASPNPPGDVRDVAAEAAEMLRALAPAAEITLHETDPQVTNLVARIRGAGPGRLLAYNGHLDTYPVNEALHWTVPPLGGLLRDGRLYGRGVADMKGGIAASMLAFALLAEYRDAWRGEALLTLAGDEESMGPLGTKWLLDHVPGLAQADGVIIGDAGSPRVLRFGEKGFVWIEIEAAGRASHGARRVSGRNAADSRGGSDGGLRLAGAASSERSRSTVAMPAHRRPHQSRGVSGGFREPHRGLPRTFSRARNGGSAGSGNPVIPVFRPWPTPPHRPDAKTSSMPISSTGCGPSSCG